MTAISRPVQFRAVAAAGSFQAAMRTLASTPQTVLPDTRVVSAVCRPVDRVIVVEGELPDGAAYVVGYELEDDTPRPTSGRWR